MNILFVTNYFPNPDGLQDAVFLYERAKVLIDRGHHVSVLKWDQNVGDFFKQDYVLSDLESQQFSESILVKRVHSLQLWNPIYKQNLYSWIKREFDLVHFHWLWSMSVFPEISKWDIPYCVTCHGSDINLLGKFRPQIGVLKSIVDWDVSRQMHRLSAAHHVMFVSTELEKTAKEKGFFGASSVIPNGVNDALFYPEKVQSFPPSFRIGYVGNLLPVKGVDRLPKIFQALNETLDSFTVILMGSGPLKTALQAGFEQVGLKDRVCFLGQLSPIEVADVMRTLSVLVLPSRSEAFGCVIKEAQACGVPVVGTRVGGIPSSVGLGGLTVEDGDGFEHRFSKAIYQMLHTPVSSEILENEVKLVTWKETVGQELALYNQILATV